MSCQEFEELEYWLDQTTNMIHMMVCDSVPDSNEMLNKLVEIKDDYFKKGELTISRLITWCTLLQNFFCKAQPKPKLQLC